MPPAFFHRHGTFHGLVDLRHSALGVGLLSWACSERDPFPNKTVRLGAGIWTLAPRCGILKNGEGGQAPHRPDRPVSRGYFFSSTLAKMAKTNTTTAKSRSSIRPTSFLGSGETPEGPVLPHRALGFRASPPGSFGLLTTASQDSTRRPSMSLRNRMNLGHLNWP